MPRFGPLRLSLDAHALAAACASTPEEDPMQLKLNDLDARVARVERGVKPVAMSQHLDEMEAQMRELRGRIEELEHNAEMRKEQQDLYTT